MAANSNDPTSVLGAATTDNGSEQERVLDLSRTATALIVDPYRREALQAELAFALKALEFGADLRSGAGQEFYVDTVLERIAEATRPE